MPVASSRALPIAFLVLRILVVLFGAVLGYLVGSRYGGSGDAVLGVFDAPVLGLVVGGLAGGGHDGQGGLGRGIEQIAFQIDDGAVADDGL